MRAGSSITSETKFLDADAPGAPPRTVLPRRSDHECMSSHRADHLISVLRDPKKPNSEVVVSPVADPGNTTARSPAWLAILLPQPGSCSKLPSHSQSCRKAMGQARIVGRSSKRLMHDGSPWSVGLQRSPHLTLGYSLGAQYADESWHGLLAHR